MRENEPLRHLLGMDGLSREAIAALLDLGEAYLEAAASGPFKSSKLRGRTIVNLFYEASTRTRTSFEIAGKRLGADVVNVSASTSSASKGESLFDTVANLAAMGADAVVLRHGAAGAPHVLARRFPAAIVNAGDGMHEHPTQALLDALTIRRKKGTIADLVVAICGDILHSRVARSNAHLLATMGASVRLAGPRTLLPPALAASRGEALLGATPVDVFDRIEPALQGADVVMMLRVQRERMGGALLPSAREYARTFGLNEARLALAHPEALVMHPGPMNRGVEIDPAVADGPKSAILDQVEAGVAVRTAVLATLLSEDPSP